jgi:hypothetical protein
MGLSVPPLVLVAFVLYAFGTAAMLVAIVFERLMHRHRQPGVTYAQATFRRDGGWRRDDLFLPRGLAYQRKASTFGVLGAGLWVLGLIAFAATRLVGG